MKLWCNSHQRLAERCKTEGGILLPCQVVDLDEIGLELIEEETENMELKKMDEPKFEHNLASLRKIVKECRYEPWRIEVYPDVGARAYYLQVKCGETTCNDTGDVIPGWSGRKWRLSVHMTETEVVKTALKAVMAAQEHETLEMFTYKGVSIFDPHIRVEDLLALRRTKLLDRRS